jgi:hypothetical protein
MELYYHSPFVFVAWRLIRHGGTLPLFFRDSLLLIFCITTLRSHYHSVPVLTLRKLGANWQYAHDALSLDSCQSTAAYNLNRAPIDVHSCAGNAPNFVYPVIDIPPSKTEYYALEVT